LAPAWELDFCGHNLQITDIIATRFAHDERAAWQTNGLMIVVRLLEHFALLCADVYRCRSGFHEETRPRILVSCSNLSKSKRLRSVANLALLMGWSLNDNHQTSLLGFLSLGETPVEC
jgi:hypothetical protein